jgi:hypothetical protein
MTFFDYSSRKEKEGESLRESGEAEAYKQVGGLQSGEWHMGVCQFNYVYSDYSKSTAAARLILRNQPGFFGAVHGTGLQWKVVQLVFFSKSAFSTLHRQILSNRYTLREQVQSSRYATSDSITILYSLQIEEQHRCRVQHTCSITTTTQSV